MWKSFLFHFSLHYCNRNKLKEHCLIFHISLGHFWIVTCRYIIYKCRKCALNVEDYSCNAMADPCMASLEVSSILNAYILYLWMVNLQVLICFCRGMCCKQCQCTFKLIGWSWPIWYGIARIKLISCLIHTLLMIYKGQRKLTWHHVAKMLSKGILSGNTGLKSW